MKLLNPKHQNGFALLIFVVMLMGIGGFVLVGYGQGVLKEVEVKKFEHNERVLKEAKQALLQFAYNYPVTNGNGPGRLPCADIDNDGDANTVFGECITLGRLPWNEQSLNFYDARDADGQRLWYAVSDNFATNVSGGNIINSDSFGNITVRDQTGNVIFNGLHPGDIAKSGVAAVVIAPGAITSRNGVLQNRFSGAEDPFDTTADTEPGIKDADNYLDQLGVTEDNANFTLDSATDGFILGPIDDGSGAIVVNDQIIVITAAEVIEVAEKAVLQAYRTALQNYDQRIDTDIGAGDHYPWLFDYAVNDYGDGYPELDDYPSNPAFATELLSLGSDGRIPSIFTDYFTETDGQPIESRLGINLILTYPISPSTVEFNQASAVCPSNPAINCTTGNLNFDVAGNHVFNQTSFDPYTGVTFQDIAAADIGRLTATVVTPQTFTDVRYFWDERPVGDGWTQCIFAIGDETDCNRDAGGINVPGFLPNLASQVIRVQVDVNLNGVINFDMNYAAAPGRQVINISSGVEHAKITGSFAGVNLDATTMPVTVNYIYDSLYNFGFNNQANGTLLLADLLQGGSSLALTLRYYPELPDWAYNDGWHDSIQMAYANNLRPDIAGACVEAAPLPANRCLTVNNMAGNIDNKKSILIIAEQVDWNDTGAAGLLDDVGGIFGLENENLDDIFDARAVNNSDKILVVDEL